MNSFRDILKWGDKREQTLEASMTKMLHTRFGDVASSYPKGDIPLNITKPSALTQDQVLALFDIVGAENVNTEPYARITHSYGKYYTDLLYMRNGVVTNPPDAVVYPRTHTDVVKLIAYCNAHKIPIIPFGGNSSVTRGLEAPLGGISLDLTRHLNKVVYINITNQTVTVQAGMYGPALEKALNEHAEGYTCGHFPQSFEFSTVGGWAVTKGAGQMSTGYGKMEDMVLGLKVVTPVGEIETKDFPRSAQGWDLNHTFLGSEGTLGIVTEVTMKIRKFRPKNTSFASFVFKSFDDAVNTMRITMQSEFGFPHLFRISDPEETDIAFKTKGFDESFGDKVLQTLGYKSGKRCLMFVACEGDAAHARFVIRKIKGIASGNNGLHIGGKPTRKWLEQRYESAYLRDPLMDKGIMTDTLETAVSWANLSGLWKNARAYAEAQPNTLMMVHISHVYENGANLYFTFLSPMQMGNEYDSYILFHKGLVDTLVKSGGSLSHHHGVGRVMAPWMQEVLGKNYLDALKAIKLHFDPNNIMNPGQMLGLD